MGLKIVDDGYGKTPELRKDDFWDDQWVPLYSEESAWEKKYTQHEGSLSHMKLVESTWLLSSMGEIRDQWNEDFPRIAAN